MRDKQSAALIQQLHPKVRADFQAFIEECEQQFDLTIRIMSAMRSMQEQERIYAQGRTAPGPIVSNAPPGSSFHNFGMALDVLPLGINGEPNYNYDQSKWQNIASQWNITWGGAWTGSFKDPDHWEEKLAPWRDLLTLYHQGKLISGTQYVDI